jgi:hypothetical protein
MTVSEVGRIAIGMSRSLSPALVTHATSGAKPSMCDFSFSSTVAETNIGKYAFSTPIFLISVSNQPRSGECSGQRTLDEFPDGVRPGFEDVAPGDVVVVQLLLVRWTSAGDHIAFHEDLLIPVGEIEFLSYVNTN